MSIKVHLYSSLQNYTHNQPVVEAKGTTVGQCLDDLVKQFPALKPELFDKENNLLPHVFVSINLNSAKPEKLTSPITDRDALYIVLIIAGG